MATDQMMHGLECTACPSFCQRRRGPSWPQAHHGVCGHWTSSFGIKEGLKKTSSSGKIALIQVWCDSHALRCTMLCNISWFKLGQFLSWAPDANATTILFQGFEEWIEAHPEDQMSRDLFLKKQDILKIGARAVPSPYLLDKNEASSPASARNVTN